MTTTTAAPKAPAETTTPAAEPAAQPDAEAAGRRRQREALRLRGVVAGRYSGPTDTEGMEARARILALATRAVPEEVRGNRGDIFMHLLWAQALDIPEALSFQHVFFSDRGVPGIHAAFMHALVIRAGHRIEVLHADGKKVVLRLRYDDGRLSPQVSWHILEAQRAGLHIPRGDRNVWRLYGADMLWARAVSRLCRRHCPDVTGGLHTPEDLADGVDLDADSLAPDEPETDPDGQPVVAADVAAFLAECVDAERQPLLTADELAAKWKLANELGLLTQFAGRDEAGINLSVQEVLFDAGEAARTREAAAGTLTGGGQDHSETAHLTDMHQADEADAREAAAAAGAPIGCGCPADYVARTGNHKPGCFDYIEPQDDQERDA